MEYTKDYLLDKKVTIFQPVNGYRASIDAVLLSSIIDVEKVKEGANILDVGSGTGGISLCLAYRLQNKNVKITGVDIQDDLISLSNKSAETNGFADFLHYEKQDIREKTTLEYDSYDIVITNPPYSDHDMPSPNESKKLAHNHQNFNLSEWLLFSLKMLRAKGYIALVNRTEAIDEILQAMHNRAGSIKIIPLYSKENQISKRILVLAQKGSRGKTEILPPLYTHNKDGAYSEKVDKILRKAQSYFE